MYVPTLTIILLVVILAFYVTLINVLLYRAYRRSNRLIDLIPSAYTRGALCWRGKWYALRDEPLHFRV